VSTRLVNLVADAADPAASAHGWAEVLIAIVLALLLCSLVAPVYLMLAVMGGYAASLGAAVFIFQGLGGEPGCCSCCRSWSTCSWWPSAPTTTS
jgi:hypothetical protein